MSSKPAHNVALLIYPGADILDYAGPAEVLATALYDWQAQPVEPVFNIDTVARDDLSSVPTGRSIHGVDYLHIRPSTKISQVLADISKYDVLIVPGAAVQVFEQYLPGGDLADGQEIALIKAFASTPTGENLGQGKGAGNEKVLLSVCSGALLLAGAGILDGLEATTHHMALSYLEKATDGKTKVARGKRWVDVLSDTEGLRVITSGGVSSGIDSTLHLVALLAGEKLAEFLAKVMEHKRRERDDGTV